MTRIIKITECAGCPHVDGTKNYCNAWDDMLARVCPPTGTPDWCPLEAIEDAGGGR